MCLFSPHFFSGYAIRKSKFSIPDLSFAMTLTFHIEHIYHLPCRIAGSDDNAKFFCNCGASEGQSCEYDDSLPGMSIA